MLVKSFASLLNCSGNGWSVRWQVALIAAVELTQIAANLSPSRRCLPST